MYLRITLLLLTICFSWFCGGQNTVAAQIDDSLGISLITSPQYPSPNSTVTVSLDAYTINTTGATIVWTVDDIERTTAKNNRSITVTTKNIGEKTTVRATIYRDGNLPLPITTTIVPTAINIILEADTYTPSFYAGRALPSGQSQIRAVAVVLNGTNAPASAYTYKWEHDDEVLLGGPVTGKSDISFTMPRYNNDTLNVTVTDAKGNVVGQDGIVLVPKEPELHFYDENPLRGLSAKAVTNTFILIGDEATVHGIPYFMNTDLTAQTTTFEWKIDGKKVDKVNAESNTITLRRTGGAGKASIELSALTTTRIPQYVKKAFTIFFE